MVLPRGSGSGGDTQYHQFHPMDPDPLPCPTLHPGYPSVPTHGWAASTLPQICPRGRGAARPPCTSFDLSITTQSPSHLAVHFSQMPQSGHFCPKPPGQITLLWHMGKQLPSPAGRCSAPLLVLAVQKPPWSKTPAYAVARSPAGPFQAEKPTDIRAEVMEMTVCIKH